MPRTSDKKTDYMNRVFGRQDERLKEIIRASSAEQVLPMQITPHEGRILYILAKIAKVRKAVEIGTLYGYSTLHLARALPEGGVLWTCDKNEERQKKAREILKKSPEYKKIRWICGPAQKTLSSLEDKGPFDLVFVDADKEAYGKYLQWAENHIRPGGILLADNTFLFGAVYGEDTRSASLKAKAVMEKFNTDLAESGQWAGAMIPTNEGLTLAVRK